jgi:BolA family transcriptional regulator, general stress-responsive regulator
MSETLADALEVTIKDKLQAALSPQTLVLSNESFKHRGHAGAGEGSHWHLRIVSDAFVGKTQVARHKLVYRALQQELAGAVHALAIDALSPDET